MPRDVARSRRPACRGLVGGLILAALAATGCDETPEDTRVIVEALPTCDEQFVADSDFVVAQQFGVDVRNLYHHNIFRFDSKRAPWRPITGFRASVCGNVDGYYIDTGHEDQDEYDWNID